MAFTGASYFCGILLSIKQAHSHFLLFAGELVLHFSPHLSLFQVEAEHVEFDPVRMDISPANAVLPDIVPSRYELMEDRSVCCCICRL